MTFYFRQPTKNLELHLNETSYIYAFGQTAISSQPMLTRSLRPRNPLLCVPTMFTEIVFPEPTKIGYTFDYWCSDPELSREYAGTTMPAGNVTLYAKWNINQYTITFIFNNGDENEVRTLDFNEEIDYPESIEKEGYTFNGWDNKPDRMPAENITVTAQWSEIEEPFKPSKPTKPSEYVEVVFGKAFTQDEVMDILDDYTKDTFTITGFDRDERLERPGSSSSSATAAVQESLLRTSARMGRRSTSSGVLTLPQERGLSLSPFLLSSCSVLFLF